MAKIGIREENHIRIISVGKALFIEQGVAKTTLSQIAGRAGVVKKTVLNIFTSKNNLVLLCAIAVWDDFCVQLDKIVTSKVYREKSGLEQVMALQIFRARCYADHPNYADLILEIESITCKNSEERHSRALWMKRQADLFTYFDKALQKGAADGSIRLKMNHTQAFTFLFVWYGSIIQRFGHIQKNNELALSLDIHTIMRNTLQQMRTFLQATNQNAQQEELYEG